MRLRLLLVEDDDDAREVVAEHLGDLGFEVRTATDHDDALKQTTDWLPGVILVDVGLPGIDGFTVVRTLRERYPEIRNAPAVAITAYPARVVRQLADQEGFVDVLTKPLSLDVLERVLAKLVHA